MQTISFSQKTTERDSESYGHSSPTAGLSGVVSVFPERARKTPEDKLKALADLEFQQGKLCA